MRKKVQKITAFLLAVLLLTTVLPFSVLAAVTSQDTVGASSGTTGNCTWTLNNGVLTISGNGAMGNYTFTWSSSLGHYVSTAPWGCNITSVIINDGVTSIGSSAFVHCSGLKNVIIPDSMTIIGDAAFLECTGLTSVYITDLAAWCGITFISRSSNPLYFAHNLYQNNKPITDLIIPDGVARIEDFAFYHFIGLTSIIIPGSVTSIGHDVFSDCNGLTSITIPGSVTSIGEYAFSCCIGLTSATIHNGVTSIEWCAFGGCLGLTSITIPDSVTSIGYNAFLGCGKLRNVYYGGNKTQWNRIGIAEGNDCLSSARILFNAFISTMTPVNTNSSSSSQSNAVSVKTANNSALNIELEKDLSFTVPSNVPLIGGGEMKLDLSSVPLTAAITDNSIRIGIGYNRDLTKETDEQTWCNWKNYVKGYKDAISKGKGLFGDITNKMWGRASAGMGKDLDFEFYGYFEGTIKNGEIIGSGYAKIKLEGALKKEWQIFVLGFPIVVKLKGKVGFENTASLSLNLSTKKLCFTNQLDITFPQITASAGVGIAHIADASVYGDAKNVFSIYSNPQKVTGTLFGELGVSLKAFGWSDKFPLVSVGNGSGWTYYDSSKNSCSSSVGAFDYDDLNFTINRSYLKNQSEWLSGKSKSPNSVGSSGYNEFTYNVLQTSIYDGAAPKLIKTNDDMIMVWTGDDKTRSDGNQTVAYYSVFDNDSSTWNAPIAVEDNGTADFTPDIATDGENTYLAWTDAKTVFDSNVEMSEVAAACEIKLAKFNESTKQFEDVVLLTDNDTLDISPNIAVTNGSVAVLWKNNSANVFLENAGTETVYKAIKTENGFTTTKVYSSQNKIYEFITDGENTAFSVDGDGDLTDATDSEIYTINSQNLPAKLTDNASAESNLAFSRINGETVLTYLCDGTLYGSTNLTTTTALSAADTMIFGQYQFVGEKLFSVESIEGSAEIFSYSTNEEGLWSNPVQVSFAEKYIRNPSFVDNDGEINCVFLNTSAIISEDDVIETTDLCTSVIPDFHSIEIEDISYNSEDVIPGEALPVTIALRNNGTVDESTLTVSVIDESGNTVVNTTISKEIKSGQNAEFETEIPLDSSLNSKTTYEVKVSGVACDDSDELTIGYTQLMFTTKTGIQDETLGVLLNISNDSAIATNASLVVKASEDTDEVLDIFSLGEIGANTSFSYYLNNERICAYKEQTDDLYLELVSEKDEISLADNIAIVSLLSFSQYKLGDMNSDGSININDVTAIQLHAAEIDYLSEQQLAVADLNNDGAVTIADATLLQMYLAEYDVVLGRQTE